MGVGAAFPFSVFVIIAAYLVYRRPFTTTLFADIAAARPGVVRMYEFRLVGLSFVTGA